MPDRAAPPIRTAGGLLVRGVPRCGISVTPDRMASGEVACNTSGRCISVARVPEEFTMTSLITPSASTDIDDGPAIAELHRLHAAQKAAFLADPYPDAAARAASLGALAGMIMSHRAEIPI